jgi:hypothetical protein
MNTNKATWKKMFGVAGRFRILVDNEICAVKTNNERFRAKLSRHEVLAKSEVILEEEGDIEAAAKQQLMEICVLMMLMSGLRDGGLEITDQD